MAEGIDLREFRKLRKDLREFNPDKELKKTLRLAGALIAEEAKAKVGPYSHTVPGSIKVRISKTIVQVRAGGPEVPMAGLLESGNRGRGGRRSGRKFRHPVFGDMGNWVEQDMHPYLMAATESKTHAIEALEGHIVAEAFREVGWKGA